MEENSIQKGDSFEEKSYKLIQAAIASGELSLIASQCKVFRKKGYYSHTRKSDIIFDLTIEVWPPNATRYTLLYIVECKNYNGAVPVNDIEEFHNKIQQVAGVNVKGIFITNNGFQRGAYNIGESEGMMLITLNYDQSYNILLHKIDRTKKAIDSNDKINSWDDTIEQLLIEKFNKQSKIQGLKQLSGLEIENITKVFLNEYNPTILTQFCSVPIRSIGSYLEEKYDLVIEFATLKFNSRGNDILGCYSHKENKIYIDSSIAHSDRLPFILAHEIGHYILHRDLKMNQNVYDSFSDSEYNFEMDKHTLTNDRQWIEWQANHFAASLIVPAISLKERLIEYQEKNAIRNKGTVYYDSQPINLYEFSRVVSYLADFFKVTKTNIIYRMNDTGIMKYDERTPKHWTNFMQ